MLYFDSWSLSTFGRCCWGCFDHGSLKSSDCSFGIDDGILLKRKVVRWGIGVKGWYGGSWEVVVSTSCTMVRTTCYFFLLNFNYFLYHFCYEFYLTCCWDSLQTSAYTWHTYLVNMTDVLSKDFWTYWGFIDREVLSMEYWRVVAHMIHFYWYVDYFAFWYRLIYHVVVVYKSLYVAYDDEQEMTCILIIDLRKEF